MVGNLKWTSLKAILTREFRNPTLEEQALARIHRIGQKQSVTTVRFYVRDSFEEVSTTFPARKRNSQRVLINLTASHGTSRVEEESCRGLARSA